MIRRDLLAVEIALSAAVAIGSALMLVVGQSPAGVWWTMIERTFGHADGIGEWLFRATGPLLTGLGVSVALDAGLFNIGGEAQLTAGVVGCAVVGAALPHGTPAIVALPLCIAAAAAGGGAIGALIGAMRVLRGAHEVITSIMLDKIVAGAALWLGNDLLFVPGTTTGPAIAPGAELPRLGLGGSPANAAIAIAVAAVAIVWWVRARTTWGQALRAVGRDPDAARSVGISVGAVRLLAMTFGGALAGLAATNYVLGQEHVFQEGLGRGVGFIGITAALLGRLHPVGVALAALLLGFLSAGGLQVADRVPKELTELLQGIVLLAIAIAVPWVRRREAA
ncbi:MAG TPA: ABC transporter permease [Kofleriaceae bacterium]|nr:ABC transporter permease [Kofleriaceae bacterium]